MSKLETETHSEGAEPSIRAFIAITPPPEIRDDVGDLIERLGKALHFTPCRPTWARPETLHLTLLFLGRLPLARVPEVEQHLHEAAAQFHPLRLRLRELGIFPHWNDPRVLWLGVRDKTRQLAPLQAELERRLGHLAYRPDGQAFHPHLKLARFKSLKGTGPARKMIENHARFEAGPFECSQITLFRSELHGDGALHTPLATALIPLQEARP